MARELSGVLDHVAKIDELDLEGVAPTSHVVEVERAARRISRAPCLPREVALARRPRSSDGGFVVPSPQA